MRQLPPLHDPGDSSTLVAGLAKSHGTKLHRFLAGRVRNLYDVPDIVQEVFLRMLRAGDPSAIRSPEAYLFTVASHVAQQHAAREATAPISTEAIELFAQLEAASTADPMLQCEAEQSVEQVLYALAKLSPMVRATFVLNRHHGLSLKEIAEELHISFPMAKKYLAKALLQFRKHLGTY